MHYQQDAIPNAAEWRNAWQSRGCSILGLQTQAIPNPFEPFDIYAGPIAKVVENDWFRHALRLVKVDQVKRGAAKDVADSIHFQECQW